MTDKQRTCGDCAWYADEGQACGCPKNMVDVNHKTDTVAIVLADECDMFQSITDSQLIDECHRLRSLGAAVEWSKIDRLVEIAAGRELERVNRCEWCEGHGDYGVYVDLHGDRVECPMCQGTGYKKGGER